MRFISAVVRENRKYCGHSRGHIRRSPWNKAVSKYLLRIASTLVPVSKFISGVRRASAKEALRGRRLENLPFTLISMPWQTREFERKYSGNCVNMMLNDYCKADLVSEC